MARTHEIASTIRRLFGGALVAPLVASAVLFAGCGLPASLPSAERPPIGAEPPTAVPVAAPPAATPSAAPAADTAWRTPAATVMISPVSGTAAGWSQALVLPYGEEPEALGNGMMSSLLATEERKAEHGPTLATVDAQGRWWVADQFKHRIARYAADGTYLDAISLEATEPLEALEVFDDGRALGLTADGRWVVAADDRATNISAEQSIVFAANDGSTAYGWSLFGDRTGAMTVADDRRPTNREVRWFTSRAGTQYGIDFAGEDQIVVTLPESRVRLTLDVMAETGQPVFVSTEFDTDRAGNIHLLLIGNVVVAPESEDEPDERFVTRAAHVVVSPRGELLANRAVPDPYGMWDYGVPQRFHVRPDTGTAHIVTVEPDGVAIWQSGQSWAAASSPDVAEVSFTP